MFGRAIHKSKYELITPLSVSWRIFPAISAIGLIVAIVSGSQFLVFNTTSISLACIGVIEMKEVFKYGIDRDELIIQPLPFEFDELQEFRHVALSDSYIAIGSGGRVIIFRTTGQDSGSCISYDEIIEGWVSKLAFSPDGKELFAFVGFNDTEILWKKRLRAYEVRIYSLENLEQTDLNISISAQENVLAQVKVEWLLGFGYHPSALAFSASGTKIAISIEQSGGEVKIGILKREGSSWEFWGQEVSVHIAENRVYGSQCIMGLSLYSHGHLKLM